MNKKKISLEKVTSKKNNPKKDNSFKKEIHTSVSISKGPLPPPEILKRYDEIVPSGAERIVIMVEKELDHRIGMEKILNQEKVRSSFWGQILGFLIFLTIIAASLCFVFLGHEGIAATLIGVDLVSLVYIFVAGRKSKH